MIDSQNPRPLPCDRGASRAVTAPWIQRSSEWRIVSVVNGLGLRVYLDPKEPPFLGLLVMISLSKSLEKGRFFGV